MFEAAIVALVLTSIPQPKLTPLPEQISLHEVEQNVIRRTNAERVSRGLRPLVVDERLMTTARKHGRWMARSGNFRHGNYNVGENIAMGQPNSAGALNAWMNSSGHRANILNRGYSRIGVAAFRNRGGTVYWVQQFLR